MRVVLFLVSLFSGRFFQREIKRDINLLTSEASPVYLLGLLVAVDLSVAPPAYDAISSVTDSPSIGNTCSWWTQTYFGFVRAIRGYLHSVCTLRSAVLAYFQIWIRSTVFGILSPSGLPCLVTSVNSYVTDNFYASSHDMAPVMRQGSFSPELYQLPYEKVGKGPKKRT